MSRSHRCGSRIGAAITLANVSITRLMILAPPQHGKSELASVRFPAFWLANRPDDPIILTSYAASLATGFSRQARDVVESTEFQRIFPKVIRHEYRFLAWQPVREGTLEIEGETVPTRLGITCPGTGEQGCTGQLRRFGTSHVYGLWAKGQHGPDAHILVNTQVGGKAIPLLCHPYASTPTGIVGKDMRERLEVAEEESQEVTFTCQTDFFPNTPSSTSNYGNLIH